MFERKCGYYLSDQVVFCVGHIHSVPLHGDALRGVKGSFRQLAVLFPTFWPWDRNDNPMKIMVRSVLQPIAFT